MKLSKPLICNGLRLARLLAGLWRETGGTFAPAKTHSVQERAPLRSFGLGVGRNVRRQCRRRRRDDGLVSVKIIELFEGLQCDGHIDLKQCLTYRVALCNIAQVHFGDPLLRPMKRRTELRSGQEIGPRTFRRIRRLEQSGFFSSNAESERCAEMAATPPTMTGKTTAQPIRAPNVEMLLAL